MPARERLLSAYYFMGQDLCINPDHTRADMECLGEHGFDSIAVGIADFQFRTPQGVELICEEATRAGLGVLAIPSRWGGLVAGWPAAPGHFNAARPDTWMLAADGSPLVKGFCGPMCSVYHPDVLEFYRESIDATFRLWPVSGVIWDELKPLHEEDHHPLAVAACGGPSRGEAQVARTVEFFAEANRHLKAAHPEATVHLFLYAWLPQELVDAGAGIEGLDYFGLDGKAYPRAARSEDESPEHFKFLPDEFPRFAEAARREGLGTLALVETQELRADQNRRNVEHLPAFLASDIDHLLVYYHPLVKERDARVNGQVLDAAASWRAGAF